MYKRSYLQGITDRMIGERSFVQVLSGPRQIGKTTLMYQLMDGLPFESLYVTADDVPAADRNWLRRTWDDARRKLTETGGSELLLIIDEIQKIENWSETVKKEWDEDSRLNRNLKVILLGSSSLLIQTGLTESMAGRFEIIHLTHWTYPEMRDAFGWDVNQYIWFGGYPGSAKLIGDELRWKNYIRNSLIETSISKDVLMMTRVDKPALLKRLFEIGCVYSAQIVSLNKVQGELQEKGNLTTLSNYLKLVEGAGLLGGLEKYSGDIIRKRSSKPKFQAFNNALVSSLHGSHYRDIQSDRKAWGRLAESAVGAHLINAAVGGRFNLYYWNENSREVDFVMERQEKVIAIEVKSGHAGSNEGMNIFDAAYHPDRMFTVGTDGIPFEEFLSSDPVALFDI